LVLRFGNAKTILRSNFDFRRAKIQQIARQRVKIYFEIIEDALKKVLNNPGGKEINNSFPFFKFRKFF